MRLIDADALKENCYKQMDELMESTSEHLSAEALSLLCGFTLIDSAPSIEPKRGEWNKPNYGQCSNCRGWAIETENGYYFSDFCPNCGARMKGKDNG